MGIGTSEIILIILFVLIFFGAKKIPEFARGLGKGLREVKKATDDIKSEIYSSTSEIKKEVDEAKDDFNKTVNS